MAEKTPPPPDVWSFPDLLEFRQVEKDSIILSIDFEQVDHNQHQRPTDFHKMSEVGIAYFDPRDGKSSTISGGTEENSNKALERLGAQIRARHFIVTKWKNISEETCNAWIHHREKNPVPHKAHPYHCAFARSGFRTPEASINEVKSLINKLCSQNLTEEEVSASKQRSIRIIFWAARTEASIFNEAGLDLASLGPNIQIWDYQLWSPFQGRFRQGNQRLVQAGAEAAFKSLGAWGATRNGVAPPLHNATNDTVAQLLAYLRFSVMTESEWNSWLQKIDLAPITLSWIKSEVYEFNYSKRPMPKAAPGNKKNGRQGGDGNTGNRKSGYSMTKASKGKKVCYYESDDLDSDVVICKP